MCEDVTLQGNFSSITKGFRPKLVAYIFGNAFYQNCEELLGSTYSQGNEILTIFCFITKFVSIHTSKLNPNSREQLCIGSFASFIQENIIFAHSFTFLARIE